MAEFGCELPRSAILSPKRRLRILLVVGDPALTSALRQEFERDGVWVDIANTLAAARSALQARVLDVIIIDSSLRDGRGETLLAEAEGCFRQPAVILMVADLAYLDNSAFHYRPVIVPKPVDGSSLFRIATTVARGYAGPTVDRFIHRFKLTKREAQATTLITRGLMPKEVASLMGCGEKAVYAHLGRVCRKTGCADYHKLAGMILAFSCHVLGHTPPEHEAFGGSTTRL